MRRDRAMKNPISATKKDSITAFKKLSISVAMIVVQKPQAFVQLFYSCEKDRSFSTTIIIIKMLEIALDLNARLETLDSQAKRGCKLACERVSADCSAVVRILRTGCVAPNDNVCTA